MTTLIRVGYSIPLCRMALTNALENDERPEINRSLRECRLSINTNFSSKAGYALRINMTIDVELGGQGPWCCFFTLLNRQSMRSWNVIKHFLSFEICCSCVQGTKLRWQIIVRFIIRCFKGLEFVSASRAHSVTIVRAGCGNL